MLNPVGFLVNDVVRFFAIYSSVLSCRYFLVEYDAPEMTNGNSRYTTITNSLCFRDLQLNRVIKNRIRTKIVIIICPFIKDLKFTPKIYRFDILVVFSN